jgi:uncharacterized repeat protein (TIGR01451 family)
MIESLRLEEERDMRILVTLALVLGIGVAATAGLASAEGIPTADLAVVSKTADVSHAKIGDLITFTIVATNNGPDVAELDVVEDLPAALAFVSHECDRGISPDGPFCEYGFLQPGETVTTTLVALVLATDAKYATNTACVLSEQAITDTDTSNDCASVTVKIVGKRT